MVMWTRPRAFYLGLSVLSFLGRVLADKTITVDGRDTSIRYSTVTNGDDGATWTPVQRSSDSCDTPQTLTSRLGDYMTFTFTGTGIFVIGTTGVKQGIINFTLDGQNITNFDRGRSELMCDQVLFQKLDLPLQQHTVVGTLVGRNMNLQTGQLDGVFSVQRVRYNIPGSDGGSTSIGPIIGGIVGAIALLAAGGLAYYFWRKRHPKRRSNSDFWDNDDLGGGKHTTNPGIVATPFEWDGPSKPQGGNIGTHYGGVEGEQAPGSPSFAATQPLLGNSSSPPWSASAHTTSFSGPSSSSHNNLTNNSNPNVSHNQLGAPMLGPRTHTSSGSGDRRGSGLTGSTLVASNPDPGRGEKNPAMFAMGPISGRHDTPGPAGPAGPAQPGRPTSGPIDETQLVDRIAHRLADIMTERVGVAGSEAPPSYVGDDGEYFGPPPQPPSAAPQDTASPSPAPAGNSTYPPQTATSPRPPTSPQYVQSPPSATTPGQLQPPTPPAGTTSFGAAAGAGRFGPRPRPSGSVSGRPGEYTGQRTMSRDQSHSPRGPA
ncbi:hypothetical protein FS837_001022 [Tulasnella sp. UAMH 9824]|nr:hypothetical protein FS837_001022 [Tulasnella sp. UAMH 9824]